MWIGKIFESKNKLAQYQCVDSRFSTHNTRGACSYHSGLLYRKTNAKQPESIVIDIEKAKKITNEELIFLALNIPCDNDLLGALVYNLEKKYNAKKQMKSTLMERLQKFVRYASIGTARTSAALHKYILREEYAKQYPELKKLSDRKLNECLQKIKNNNGMFFKDFENNGYQSKTLIQPKINKIHIF